MSSLYFRTFDGVPIYPTASDLPAYSAIGTFASVADPVSLYQFNGSSWELLAATPATVLAVTLTGLTPTNAVIVNGDSIITAFGKTQGQITAVSGDIATVSGNLDTVSVDLDTLEVNFGLLETDVDTISGNLITVSADLVTVSGNLNTVSGNLVTVSGNLGTVSGDLNAAEVRIDNQEDQNADQVEPTGFVDTATYLAYDAANQLLTVGNGSYEVWFAGTKYTKTSESLVHATGTGSYFFVYNGGTLQVSNSPFNFKTNAPVGYVYFNNSLTPKGFCARETHGLMPYQSHLHSHEVDGAYRVSGFTASGYTVRTGNPAADQPAANSELLINIAEGVHADEDLRSTVAEFVAGSNHTHFYRSGSSLAWTVGNATPYPMGTTYPRYNQNVAGNWQLTEITAPTNIQGRWINIFVAIQQCATGSEDFEHLFIPGQQQFNSQTAALTETWETIDKSAFPAPELIPIAQATYRADPRFTAVTGRVRLEVFTPIFGTRSSRIAVSGFSPTSHPTLTNRNANSQHSSTAIGPWEWSAGTGYDATAGVEHTVTTSGMFFRAAITHTAASAFNSDWNDGDWTQLGVAIQNHPSNYSGVVDNYAAQAFPSVASGQTASVTFAATTAYLFEISLGPSGEGVLIGCDYRASAINALSDPSNVFSETNASGKIVVTKAADSAVVVIRNNVGTRNVGILPVRANISAISAWA